ncbi:MAG: hypothetical protein Q9217_001745 [Psora testacea]
MISLYALKFSFIYHLLTTYILEVANSAGPSMVPTLSTKGDWIAIDKRYRRGRGVKVGDVVDFMHPMVPSTGAVKRVVGMPGDFVLSNGGSDETGDDEGDGSVEIRRDMMIQVPEGHCWLLGDNLPESRDSRTYGPIPLALIKGKVLARVAPLREMKWVGNNLETPEDIM